MNLKFISLDEVLWLHERGIERGGGLHGVKDWGLLESALASPQNSYYESTIEVAAALLISIVLNHPFHDGNKRAAYRVTDLFLDRNGYETNFDEEEADAFIRDITVNKENRFQRVVDWLQKNIECEGIENGA